MGGQDFLQVFSYFLANVSDLTHPWAYRLHCHSCMSPYLEDQFKYIEHLYRRPMVFTEKCDHGQFDWRYVPSKNCTDACVTLRMNDRVGGRRRFGFMRGCLSDIIRHNRTAVRFGELLRTTKSGANICTAIRLRDLFISSDKYGFDPHDHVDLCACIWPNCNWAISAKGAPNNALISLALLATMALMCLFTPNANDWKKSLRIVKDIAPIATTDCKIIDGESASRLFMAAKLHDDLLERRRENGSTLQCDNKLTDAMIGRIQSGEECGCRKMAANNVTERKRNRLKSNKTGMEKPLQMQKNTPANVPGYFYYLKMLYANQRQLMQQQWWHD